MFKIYDGRENFFQWDLDRKLIVADKSIKAVHFCNRTGACSITRYCYDVNGMWLVDVPNLCLQESYRLRVYGYSEAKYTMEVVYFEVEARTKPEDYVYTEAEVACWEVMDERLRALEENPVSEETIAAAIEAYLAAHPIEKGATEAEKAQIAQNTEDIAALKAQADTYATEEYVNAAVANVKVDLTGYATEDYVDNAISGVEQDLSYYALKSEIPSLDGYAKTTDIPDVSGFQTAEQVNAAIVAYVGVIENGTY